MSVKLKISPFTVGTMQKYKNEGRKITSLTAYDYSTAKYIDEAGVDMILIGDSLSMVALGNDTTHPVTVDEMIYHTKAVARGVKRALIVTDMPFMSYQIDLTSALTNAGRFIKEANAHAVKIEGCSDHILSVVRRCVEAGIPVLGHLGFTPQFLHTLGGYKIQGKNSEATEKILEQSLALQENGAFGVVLEMVPEESARLITEKLDIPTIGIGAGRYCSGQILVSDDILGKYSDFTPKFARKYADLAVSMKKAFADYKNDVTSGNFPSCNEVFNLEQEELDKLNLKAER